MDAATSTAEIIMTGRYREFFPLGTAFRFFFLFLLFGLLFKFAFRWHRWGVIAPTRADTDHMEERMARWHNEVHWRSP